MPPKIGCRQINPYRELDIPSMSIHLVNSLLSANLFYVPILVRGRFRKYMPLNDEQKQARDLFFQALTEFFTILSNLYR